jgi:signal transduction histidine kinase
VFLEISYLGQITASLLRNTPRCMLGGIILLSLLQANPVFAEDKNTLRIAAARSIVNTAVLERLLHDFNKLYPHVRIQLSSLGSLQAHDLAREGKADIALTHYPPEDERLFEEGVVIKRSQFMYSEFAVFGPPGDELGLLQEPDIKGVLRKLARHKAPFIVPSPQGGTYLKIGELWAIATVIPDWEWYENTNTTPLGTLRLAAEQEAYAIADIATYINNQDELSENLVPLYQGGYELRNVFSVMVVNPRQGSDINVELANKFHDYLVSDRGQEVINVVNREVLKSPVFVAAAHLDPALLAEKARKDLVEANQQLLFLTIFVGLIVTLFFISLYYSRKNKILEREQSRAEMARQVAEHASEAKSEFLSRMSHELRTPMNAILGFSQLLAMREHGDNHDENIQEIIKAGEHLMVLINDVLDLSRIESHGINVHMENVSLAKTVKDSLGLTDSMREEQGIRLMVSDSMDYNVRADANRLKQVVVNFVTNAIKYNKPGGGITLSSRIAGEDRDRVRLAVADTGKGLSEAQQARLFQPFERLGAERTGIEGTGIGLVISKNLIELMGGRIGVESRPGEGSCFWLELELAPVE